MKYFRDAVLPFMFPWDVKERSQSRDTLRHNSSRGSLSRSYKILSTRAKRRDVCCANRLDNLRVFRSVSRSPLKRRANNKRGDAGNNHRNPRDCAYSELSTDESREIYFSIITRRYVALVKYHSDVLSVSRSFPFSRFLRLR